MGRVLDSQLVQRAHTAAEQAPSGKRLIDRAKRSVRYSDLAFRWATKGPRDLVAVLEDAERLAREEKGLVEESKKDRATYQRRSRALRSEVDSHPSLRAAVVEALEEEKSSEKKVKAAADAIARVRKLASLHQDLTQLRDRLPPPLYQEVEQLVSAASEDIAQLPAAIAAVDLAHKAIGLQKDIERRQAKLERSPANLTKQKGSLASQAAELGKEIAGLREDLARQRQGAVEVSAEKEHLEHAIATTAATLRGLENEAKVVTARVEGRGPAAARRIYHLLREATGYHEYRRDAEEAQQNASDLAEKLDQLVEKHNELVGRLQ